jgi:hypothetical protein
LHHCKVQFISFASSWYSWNFNNSQLIKLFCRFTNVDHHLKNVQIVIFITFVNKKTFSFKQWMQMIIRFQKHRKWRFLIKFFS